MTENTTLHMERTYEAPAQAVFDAWTSEEVMRRWWDPGNDWETPAATVDLGNGGEGHVVMRDRHKDVEYGGGGVYTEIDPPTPARIHLDLGQRPQPRAVDRDRLYDDAEVTAELPDAIARVEAGLHRDDPRRRAAHDLHGLPAEDRKVGLLKAVEIGTAASDRQHTRVRSFRNVVLVTTALLLLVVVALVAVASASPSTLPLCFNPSGGRVCPAGGGSPGEQDAFVVALLGALGGVLAAAVNIRNLRGTSTPYDVPVALSLLKVPAGALTALAALFAIRGQFVPGLSALDTQDQILAYALVFGYAQQLLTRLIDRQAGEVLDSVAGKDAAVRRPELADWPPPTSGATSRCPGSGSGERHVPAQGSPPDARSANGSRRVITMPTDGTTQVPDGAAGSTARPS